VVERIHSHVVFRAARARGEREREGGSEASEAHPARAA
jgi:hypothetical protein